VIDFSWLLFVGTSLLHFSEKEVGHMTFSKWNLLFGHYKQFYNFKIQQNLFKLEEDSSDEWLMD